MNQLKKIMMATALVTMSFGVVGCTEDNTKNTISNTVDKQVIATVNNQPIYQSDYDALYNDYYKYFGSTEDAATYLSSQKELLLEELINTEVLLQKAEKLEIICTEEEAKETLEDIKQQYGQEVFVEMLEYSNITEAEYLEQIKKQLILLKLQDSMVEGDLEITEEEIEAYYEENKASYIVGAGANMRHILIQITGEETKEELDKVEAAKNEIEVALTNGTSFEELAEKYSAEDVDSSLYIVEDLGFVEYDSPYLDADFLAGAKALAEGEVSKPVKSSFGYHFIKVEQITEATTISLDEVKNEIISLLEEEKEYARYQEQLEKWVNEATIEKYEEHITS